MSHGLMTRIIPLRLSKAGRVPISKSVHSRQTFQEKYMIISEERIATIRAKPVETLELSLVTPLPFLNDGKCEKFRRNYAALKQH